MKSTTAAQMAMSNASVARRAVAGAMSISPMFDISAIRLFIVT